MTDNTNSSRKEAQNGSTVAVERSTEGKATELHSTVSVNGDPFTFEYKVKSINGKFSGSINKDKLGKEISRKGIFTNLQNRKFYEGELKENTPHGKGKLFSADGSTYEGDFREGKMKGFGKYTYLNGSIYEGEFLNDQYNGRGKLIQANGDIYKGEFRDGEKNGKGKMIYKNGAILEGNFANGKLEENKISSVDFGKGRGSYEINSGKMTYKFPEGESFEAPFKNGSIEGPVKYNDETIEVEFGEKTGWSTVDGEKGICVNKKGDLFIGKLNANKNGPFEGILLERNGTTLEGVFNENGLLTSGKITQANGSYKWGKFDANGKLRKDCEYYKKKVEENDTITETSRAGDGSKRIFQFDGSGVQRCYRFDKDSNPIGRDTLLDGPETYGEGKERAGQINFEKIDTNTKKLSGVKFNKDGFSEGPVTYYSYDANGKPGKPVKIDYDKLNRALSEGKNWDYLLTSGAIVVRPLIETFEEVQQILRRVQEPMSKNRSQRGAQGFDGGFTEEKNLGILANLEDSESLKRVRFQKPGARGVASNEVYRSATKFLESLGINAGNINNIEEDYISVSVSIFTEKSAHAVTLVLDMEKIKKIAKEKGFDKIDSSNAILFKCFDSSRLVAKDPYRGILGGVARHTALVEKSILQAKGSCWWHSTIATIVTAENPKLLKGIESAPVFPDCPYVPMDIPTASGILSDDLSAALLQKHLDMSENNKVDLGTGKNLIEHIVDPIIIDSLEEFSKKEELLEEYDQKVQSLLEKYDQKVQSLGKRYSKDKSKKSAKKFKELVKEEKEKLSEEITDKKEEIKKKEEEELKELGETAKKNWKSFSEYLKNNSGKLEKFGKSLEDICEDLQHNGENIEYDPAKTKRAIDQVKTIAEKLNDEEEKKSLEDGIKKIEESNRAYVRKSLENRTQMLQQGLDNIEKLNEYTKSLGTFLENEAAGKTKNSILSIRALQVLKKAEATHEAELKNGEVDGKWKITKKNGDTIERNYKEGEVVAETVTKIHNLVAFNKVSAAASSVPSVSTPVPTPVSTPVSTAVSAPGENSTSSGLTSALRSASTSNLTGDLPLKTPSEVPYNKKTPERGEVNI